MIKVLTEPEEVALIISINDDVEEKYNCIRGEWVQLLVSVCKDPRTLIIGMFDEEDNMNGYIFVQNYVSPPLSKIVHIIYAYPLTNIEDLRLAIEEIKDWAREQGADKLTVSVKEPEIFINNFEFNISEYKILEIGL